jgi:hypothetical protein
VSKGEGRRIGEGGGDGDGQLEVGVTSKRPTVKKKKSSKKVVDLEM